ADRSAPRVPAVQARRGVPPRARGGPWHLPARGPAPRGPAPDWPRYRHALLAGGRDPRGDGAHAGGGAAGGDQARAGAPPRPDALAGGPVAGDRSHLVP